MTTTIKNDRGVELFSFESKSVSSCDIMDLFGPDTWDVHASITIVEHAGEFFPMMSWNVNGRKKKSVLISVSPRNFNLYTVSLFQTTENNELELIVPESWEEVLEWGR